MGVGKSTVGRMVAAQLHFQFADTDELIEAGANASVADIFKTQGEEGFRTMERSLLRDIATWEDHVIATGGGFSVQPGNLDELKKHAIVVCLWATPETVYERVKHQTHRPLLKVPDPVGRIRELLAQREPFYHQADVLLSTDRRSSRQLAQLIISEYRRLCADPPRS